MKMRGADQSLRSQYSPIENSVAGYPRSDAEEPASFKKFSAAELFCPKCNRAMPVREKMLLVLPQGNLFDYSCVKCGSSLGTRKA